jgi:hypothetical protein
MSNEIKLEEFLSFDDVDRSAPEKVVSEMCDELKSQTRDYIQGVVQPYNGYIESYKKEGISSITMAWSLDKKVDIQSDLGKVGYEKHKFEFYLSATALPKYIFRLMFFSYGIGGYPVKIVLEQSIADEIFQRDNGNYIIECKSKDDLKSTIIRVLNSKRVVRIVQELINASILAKSQEIPEPSIGDEVEKSEENTKGE